MWIENIFFDQSLIFQTPSMSDLHIVYLLMALI